MQGENFWGELIRCLREEKGLSQRVLADRASVNRSTLRRIEAGKTSADIEMMERVLSYLGYELEAIDMEAHRARIAELRAKYMAEQAQHIPRLISFRLE
ncbi:MAG: helix-turn-helix domain-containing protein [Burkholderiaceae bacterium]|nr:helix-turn-helix domain-containing protein [Burkholderiaceae bacterium]